MSDESKRCCSRAWRDEGYYQALRYETSRGERGNCFGIARTFTFWALWIPILGGTAAAVWAMHKYLPRSGGDTPSPHPNGTLSYNGHEKYQTSSASQAASTFFACAAPVVTLAALSGKKVLDSVSDTVSSYLPSFSRFGFGG